MASRTGVTIRDVAAAAGVAVSTVSRVFNQTDYSSAETRKRVFRAAERLGYVPSPAARALRQSRTMTIGVVVADLSNPINADILRGAEHIAQRYGYALLIADGQNSAAAQAAVIARLYERRVDGLIVRGPVDAEAEIARFVANGVPVIGSPRSTGSRFELAEEQERDEAGASATAFRYLIKLGHRRIAFAARRLTGQMARRLTVLQQVKLEAGVVDGESLAFAVDGLDECRALIASLSREPDPPTAYVAGSHVLAPYLLAALRDSSLRIPTDISFICYGDSPWAFAYDPPISVVKHDYYQDGSLAAQAIIRQLTGAEEALPPGAPYEFLCRGSCAPPGLL